MNLTQSTEASINNWQQIKTKNGILWYCPIINTIGKNKTFLELKNNILIPLRTPLMNNGFVRIISILNGELKEPLTMDNGKQLLIFPRRKNE